MSFRFLSLCSGIEAASAAWLPLGAACAGVAEIDPYCCDLLAHHYPSVPNLGDVTQITDAQIAQLGPLDVVAFGSPCQDLSCAGRRTGLDGERSHLFFDCLRVAIAAGPRFILWENVPGALSSHGGRDFARVVGSLVGSEDPGVPEHGWGQEGVALGAYGLVEWGCLDAQYFGLAQRRNRLFTLVDFGDWTRRAPLLLEPESLRGDAPPRREPGPRHAGGAPISSGLDGGDLARSLNGCHTSSGRFDTSVETFVFKPSYFTRGKDGAPSDVHPPLSNDADKGDQDPVVLAFHLRGREGGAMPEVHGAGDTVGALPHAGGGSTRDYLANHMAVRRLTPRECERLMGFPDDYTLIPRANGKLAVDTPRYAALGNSMAVPVMAWIGRRLATVLAQPERLAA